MGLVRAVKAACGLPLIAMIRNRAGCFEVSAAEFEVMLADVDSLREAGADGFAFGVLNASGTIDFGRARRLVAAAEGRETVFHRAFDSTPDASAALDVCVEVGCTRILTSGHAPSALEGAENLRDLQSRAAGRIQVLAGGKVRPANAADIVRRSGVHRLHAGLLTTTERGPELDSQAVKELLASVATGP